MPVVVDYAPVGAVGQLAGQVGANTVARDNAQLSMQQQGIDNQKSEADARNQLAEQQLNMQQNQENERADQAPQPQQQPQNVQYQMPTGGVIPVTQQQKMMLQQVDGNDALGDDQKVMARNNILKQPNLVPTKLASGDTVQLSPEDAARTGTAQQKVANQQDQFGQKMAAAEMNREQQSAIASQRVQTLSQIASDKLKQMGVTQASTQMKEQIQLSLQAHGAMVNEAKTHLATAQAALTGVMANTPFDDTKVNAAKAAVQAASNDYDSKIADLHDDIEKHIANLQAGAPLQGDKPDPTSTTQPAVTPSMQSVQQMGAVNVADDATAKSYLSAAGSGQVATQADVNQAMAQTGNNIDKAKAALSKLGFKFTKSGVPLN